METTYGFGTKVRLPFEDALQRVRALLQAEGFGVLTEIDVKATMWQKLGAEFRKYVILGACNPHLAHRAFAVQLEVGLLLPCNVVVYEDNGGTVVSILDPVAALGIVRKDELRPIAEEARARLERVVERLSAS